MSDLPEPNVNSVPVADVLIETTSEGTFLTESLEVRSIHDSINDYLVPLKKSLFNRIYIKLKKANIAPFKWDEISLIVFSASSSASLTAFFSDSSYSPKTNVFFFTILPIIASGSLIFSIMFKYFRHKLKKNTIAEVLAELESIYDQTKDGDN